ncbi:MAG: hypothetical protein L6R37_007786 [Teloschistes peruensis]|nr:MAG: hypothetical protein L6R37_007786 [Teloschistes peruensis]
MEVMQTLPSNTLQEIYQEDFTRMSTSGQHSRGYAVQVFALLLCAQEPLSPEAMVQALGKARSEPCEITASALFDICSNLVILDSEVNTLRFAHASFPEFLATKEEFASRNVHQIASINCLDTCLEGSPLEEDGTPLPRPDFYHYSAIYWQEHCRLASIDGLASSVVSKMREYVFDEACFGGHLSVVKTLLKYGAESKHGRGNALENAILADHEEVALTLLLDSGFVISDQAEFDSMLQQAAEAGFVEVLRLLQKKYPSWFGSSRCKTLEVALFKGRIGVVDGYMRSPGKEMAKDALATAASGGQDSMIQYLIKRGLDLNEEGLLGDAFTGSGGLYGTALQAAAHGGHTKVVEVLLDNGADPHQRGISRDAFHAAWEGGHKEIVQLLHERDFESKATVVIPCSADSPSLYKNLVRDASPSRSLGNNPIGDHQPESKDWRERASITESSHVVRMIREGVSPNIEGVQSYQDRTDRKCPHMDDKNDSLRSVAVEGHDGDELAFPESQIIAVVNRILSRGLGTDGFKTALQTAASNGHLRVLNLLINYEEKLGLADNAERSGRVPLGNDTFTSTAHTTIEAAIEGNQLSIFKRAQELVAQRCTENASRQLHREALYGAAANGTVDIMKAVLGGMTEMNLEELMKTLELVCARGTRDGLLLVIKWDTKKVLGVAQYSKALEAAASRFEQNGLPIIEAILETLRPVPSTESCVATALIKALTFFDDPCGKFQYSTSITEVMSTGPGAVVKALLAHLTKEKAGDTRCKLLLQMACMVGDQDCVELLLRRGINLDSTGCYSGGTALQATTFDGYLIVDDPLIDDGCYYGAALQAASRVSNLEMVEKFLNAGADIDVASGAHGTALRAAVLGGHEEIVRRLIAGGADVNLRHEHGGRPALSVLRLAIQSRSHTIVQALLVAGAYMTADCLSTACKEGDTSTVQLLLAGGADAKMMEFKHEYDRCEEEHVATPLHAACAAGHPSVVRLLLDNGAGVNMEVIHGNSATPLIAAVRANNLSLVRLLLDNLADANHTVSQTSFSTPLLEAVENENLDIVQELLNAGATVEKTALVKACDTRQSTVVMQIFLEHLSGSSHEAETCSEASSEMMNADNIPAVCLLLERVSTPSFDLLRQACSAGVLEAVKMLVKAGIDVNGHDGIDAPLLHVAASHSRPDVVRFLLDQAANVMLQSPKYGSPFMAALEGYMPPLLRRLALSESCRSLAEQFPSPEPPHNLILEHRRRGHYGILRCTHIVQCLLDGGAETDTTIRYYGNALHLASYIDIQVIVRVLLQKVVDVNIFGGYFESPLIAAVEGDHPAIVELLLDRGIEVNRFSPEHGTALHCACAHDNLTIIQSLLNHHADINARNNKNKSTLIVALSSDVGKTREREMLNLLLRYTTKARITEHDLLALVDARALLDHEKLMGCLLEHDASTGATEAVIVKAIDKVDISEFCPGYMVQLSEDDLATPEAYVRDKWRRMLREHKPQHKLTADVDDNSDKTGTNGKVEDQE